MAKDLLGKDYYSVESDRAFWSNSQFKKFSDCEAKALAILNGDFVEEVDSKKEVALVLGNFIHTYFESKEAHEEFKHVNRDKLIAKSGRNAGQVKKDFAIAPSMIEALETDEQFQAIYVGEKEVPVTGVIGGVKFKGKIDCLNLEADYFVDIKTTAKGIDEEVWNADYKGKSRWFEAYGYVLQMAIYQELLKQTYGREFTPIIYAVTKEEFPDTRGIMFDGQEGKINMEYLLTSMAEHMEHLEKVKNGKVAPVPCQKCNYCRKTKQTVRYEHY